MKSKIPGWAWVGARIAMGAFFIYLSIDEILSPGVFAHQIFRYQFLPEWAINPAALTLPWLQLFCGAGLLANRFIPGSTLGVFLVVMAMNAAIASAHFRGLNVYCNCTKSRFNPASLAYKQSPPPPPYKK